MFKLELTEQQLNTIVTALGKMPFESVALLIQELQKQLGPQMQAKVQTATEEPKTE